MPRPSKNSKAGKLNYLKGQQKKLEKAGKAVRDMLNATAEATVESPTCTELLDMEVDVEVEEMVGSLCSDDNMTDEEDVGETDDYADEVSVGVEIRVVELNTAKNWLKWTEGADKKGAPYQIQ